MPEELYDQSSTAYLVMKQGPQMGKRVELWKSVTTIGRSRECDIFLEDLAVSRLHATIRLLTDGNYEIEDRRSATGIFVNGMRITRYRLIEGDTVQIGSSRLTFHHPH